RLEGDGDKSQVVDVARGAGDTGYADIASTHKAPLHHVVIGGDEDAQHGEGQNVARQILVAADEAYQNNGHQRIHEDALVPAEDTGHEAAHFAVIEATERGHNGHQQSSRGRVFQNTGVAVITSYSGCTHFHGP